LPDPEHAPIVAVGRPNRRPTGNEEERMQRPRLFAVVALFATLTLVSAACAREDGGAGGGGDGETEAASTGLLAQVEESGVLRVATDPKYPPQSSFNEATGQWEGFDIDVATEIATRLGVQIEWATPSWNVLTAGRWNDRWELSVGSMTITEERAQVLNFSEPYYFTPAGLAVQEGSDVTSLDQLSGKTIGVCGACTYEFYLTRTLNIPDYEVEYLVPEDVTLKTYDTDTTAIQDLVLGRLDAVMSAVPTLTEAIDSGKEIQLLGDPVFYEPLAAAADKDAAADSVPFIERVSEIIQEMHEDGTLTELSMKWYGEDLTTQQAA
jgi:polar amino acid transport system substrate-binding protein